MDALDHREARILKLTDFIESNLAEGITLQGMAEAACYSPFHLDRVFGDIVGLTPMDYVRQRRLLCAGLRVRHEKTGLLQLANEVGFGSNASFSRAFRQFFGFSPRDWRHGAWRDYLRQSGARWDAMVAREPEIWYRHARQWQGQAEANRHDVGDRVQLRCLRGTATWATRSFGLPEGIYALMQRNNATIAELNRLGLADAASQWVYVWWTDNGFVAPGQFITELCLVANGSPPPGMVARTLPGGWYACLDFGEQKMLSAWIYEDWLEKQTAWIADATRPIMTMMRMDNGVQTSGSYLIPVRRS
ncbi:helix-turn-helix domain-containing protein [Chitinilyticum aquatile]|uniref:helix-turn-helix domain-containing protein n=1 Tax=Chitinilyticum aquatile TaxID=362520 RepID=UPI000411B28D|nr:helix-turn-helix domain-containing protein [Chitinilyticum aquatile]